MKLDIRVGVHISALSDAPQNGALDLVVLPSRVPYLFEGCEKPTRWVDDAWFSPGGRAWW